MNFKKIGQIIIFILVVFLFAFLLYIFFFRAPQTPTEETNINQEQIINGQLPPAETNGNISIETGGTLDRLPPAIPLEQNFMSGDYADGGLTKITKMIEVPTNGMTLSADGQGLRYYNQEEGKFYKITPNGVASLLSDKRFYNVESIEFSPVDNQAILEYPDGSNIYFDFTSNKQITLPKQWEDFDFSASGQEIALKSIGINPNNNWIVASNPDGTGARKIEHLGDQGDRVTIDWSPNSQVVAWYAEAISDNAENEQQELLFIGQNKENFKSTMVEGMGFQGQWSSTGDRVVYSVYNSRNDFKPDLWVVDSLGDAIGNNRRQLDLDTWSNKCAFSDNDTVYCAVPEYLEEGAGFIPEMSKGIPDTFYRVNLKTGQKEFIAQPDGNYSVQDLVISADGKYLYFTDQENLFYKMQLTK